VHFHSIHGSFALFPQFVRALVAKFYEVHRVSVNPVFDFNDCRLIALLAGRVHFTLLAPTIASANSLPVAKTFSAMHLFDSFTSIVGRCSLGALSTSAMKAASGDIAFSAGCWVGCVAGFAAGLIGTTGCLISGIFGSSFINYFLDFMALIRMMADEKFFLFQSGSRL